MSDEQQFGLKEFVGGAVALVFVIIMIWLVIQRYKLVARALQNKDTLSVLALSSPEIGQGMSALLNGLM
jgi:hypothetical protein